MDPIAEMLNQIKNAQTVQKETVSFNFSNLKYEILELLEKQGLVEKIEKKGRGAKKTVEVCLKYKDKVPLISGLKKISRSSQRIFLSAKDLKLAGGGGGMIIVSTSKGLMTSREAKKNNLGGEIICEIF